MGKSQGCQGSYKTVSGERKQSHDVNIHKFSSIMVSSSSWVDPEHTLDGRWMGPQKWAGVGEKVVGKRANNKLSQTISKTDKLHVHICPTTTTGKRGVGGKNAS